MVRTDSQVWYPVPGTRDVELYPYLRKVDSISSNSYLISTTDQIAFIDPGGLEDQLELLLDEIRPQVDKQPRPVVAYLTHAHIDHCLQLMNRPKLGDLEKLAVAVQEIGASALESKDAKATLADLLGQKVSEVRVEMKLLTAKDIASGGQRSINLWGRNVPLYSGSTAIPAGGRLHYQVVPIGNGDQLVVYHTPGHSPDSICIQAGHILFIGDLLLATRPGVAGAAGWSQRDLTESIEKVLWILDNRDIRLCLPGHGRPLDIDKVRRILQALYKETASLTGIELISPEWAESTARCAQDIMWELERLFTIIAGRLAFVAHMLGELEEVKDATDTHAIIDADLVDDLFGQFHRFSQEIQASNRPNINMVMKAGLTAEKLDQIFEKEKLGQLFDQSLLRRAERLLNDYTAIYRGFRPKYELEEVNLNQTLEAVLEHGSSVLYDEEAILGAETDEEYLKALKARIAHVNVFDGVNLTLERGDNLPPLVLDQERLFDSALDILERVAASGGKEIKLSTSFDGKRVVLGIKGDNLSGSLLDHRAVRFFKRNFALCGGSLRVVEGRQVMVEFSP